MKTKGDPQLNYLPFNRPHTSRTWLITLIFLSAGSCNKETPINISPLVHGWEVLSLTTPETGTPQSATDTYLIEFTKDKYYTFDFDRGGCGGKFSIPGNGAITLASLGTDYFCSRVTKYAHDLEGLLLTSTSYAIHGDSSLTLSGIGEIKLKRSLDCDGVGCQKNIVAIDMTITYADGSMVELTNSKLMRLSDDKVIYLSNYTSRQPDWPPILPYNLIDDSYRKYFAGKTIDVEFQGFIDNKMIVSKTFTITADCCHVSLIKGDLDIVVN